MSFDYLEFPKYYKRFEAQPDQFTESQCLNLIEKYQISNPELKISASFDSEELDVFETELNESINDNNLNLPKILSMIPKYYVCMEIKRLTSMLDRVLMANNYTEILCHLYISYTYRIWFFGGTYSKYLMTNYKRISMIKPKEKKRIQSLINLVEILTFFNNFRDLEFQDLDLTIEEIKEHNLLKEYSYVLILQQMLMRPFNEVEVNDEISDVLHGTPLLNLLHDCQDFTIDFNKYDNLALNDIDFILPIAYNTTFENYFKLVLKFKCFLNLIRISSKIPSDQVKLLIGDDNVTKYILLIGSLNLKSIGIGYNVNEDYFYNSGGNQSLLHDDIIKINEILESERISLLVKNDLVNRLTG
ncbi:hypothetical protein CLIB1444_02S01728 [[Candida] jaroonii]|uniref:Uncharacterized protein n=1 Tax=[Candida] jaroonii TaxID=467808 RepID=A0ACA9Y2X7_9ASCO|nr:hypothetical protein CLIB1444_02S01728 [[Candida] jaroonii]